MIRAVLDVNVLVSGFPASTGTVRFLIDRWQDDDYVLIVSDHVISGVIKAWRNPYFRSRFRVDDAGIAIALLRDVATAVEPVDDVHGIADDEEDDLVLATAVAGSADYLVTGDKGLLVLGSFRGVRIVTPRAFLDILEAPDTADGK